MWKCYHYMYVLEIDVLRRRSIVSPLSFLPLGVFYCSGNPKLIWKYLIVYYVIILKGSTYCITSGVLMPDCVARTTQAWNKYHTIPVFSKVSGNELMFFSIAKCFYFDYDKTFMTPKVYKNFCLSEQSKVMILVARKSYW